MTYINTITNFLKKIYFFLSLLFSIAGYVPKHATILGFRHWFIRKWNDENKGYLAYEAILGFLFFHNAASIGYVALSAPGILFHFIHKEVLFVV
ncbi:MAG: hypothetical protein QMD65_02720 [Patescibacteria group bacterium]|nr:hypothetical protein [Patescibacteria group bacterium]